MVTKGWVSGPNQFHSKPISAPKGAGRGPNANYAAFVGMPIFYFPDLLGYRGADIRTERFPRKLTSAPKGLGRGPHANYGASFGALISNFLILLGHQKAEIRAEQFVCRLVTISSCIGRGNACQCRGHGTGAKTILPQGGRESYLTHVMALPHRLLDSYLTLVFIKSFP